MACVCCNLIGLCSCPNGQSYPVPSTILAVVTVESGCSSVHQAIAGTYVIPYVAENSAPARYDYTIQDFSVEFSAGINFQCTGILSIGGRFGIGRCIPAIEPDDPYPAYYVESVVGSFGARISLCDLQQSGSIQRTISIGKTPNSLGCASTLLNETYYCDGTVTLSIP